VVGVGMTWLRLFKCWFKLPRFENEAPQVPHVNGRFCSCTAAICWVRWLRCPKDELHCSHLNGLDLICTVFSCCLRPLLFLNAEEHPSWRHRNGRCPSWTSTTCRSRFCLNKNDASQRVHWNGRSLPSPIIVFVVDATLPLPDLEHASMALAADSLSPPQPLAVLRRCSATGALAQWPQQHEHFPGREKFASSLTSTLPVDAFVVAATGVVVSKKDTAPDES
jgi:hypothetical protein